MNSLGKFASLRRKHSKLVDFVTIYIAEAHPAERKHFSSNYDICSHPHMEARIEAAKVLKEEAGEDLEGCPILVDPMDDKTNIAYGGWPERLYVIKNGTVVFEGGIGPFGYDVNKVDKFLESSL